MFQEVDNTETKLSKGGKSEAKLSMIFLLKF